MPGCAGSLEPVEGWVRKGLTCEDCAWETYCLEYFASDLKKESFNSVLSIDELQLQE